MSQIFINLSLLYLVEEIMYTIRIKTPLALPNFYDTHSLDTIFIIERLLRNEQLGGKVTSTAAHAQSKNSFPNNLCSPAALA